MKVQWQVIFDPNIRTALWEDAATLRNTLMAAASAANIVLPSFDDDSAAFGDNNPDDTITRYRSAGAGQVVVQNGPASVVTWDGTTIRHYDTPTLPGPLIGSTAAGHSFNAALMVEALRSDDIAKAGRAGESLAATVVQGHGALVETPRILKELFHD